MKLNEIMGTCYSVITINYFYVLFHAWYLLCSLFLKYIEKKKLVIFIQQLNILYKSVNNFVSWSCFLSKMNKRCKKKQKC